MHGNLSDSVLSVTLEDLNDAETIQRLAPIIYLSFLTLVGTPGNLLVIAVYTWTIKRRTTHRLFITALAVTDFLVCTVAVPFEIIQMTHQLTFYSEWACKIFRSINVLLALLSSFILIALSADRTRRVIQPLKLQMTIRQAIWCIFLVTLLAFVFAFPEAVISGISLEKLENNLTGYDCSFSDRYKDQAYTTVYSSTLLAIYIGCIFALIVMYSIIGRQVLSHVHFRSTFIRQNGTDNHSTASTNKLDRNEIKLSLEETCDSIDMDEDEFRSKQLSELKSSRENTIKRHAKSPDKRHGAMRQENSSKKVTKIAFAISFCFILSYVPYVAVKLNASIASGHFTSNATTKAIFPILGRTFIINNIVNPIIYGFLDQKFRQKCKIIFRHLTCRM
ncbi:cholecystokinin receptor type A-like [Mytilus trossulus]|uniref:cholecystokinin receptor type A-like n=1 Tax=Mytilus trossulus TaxID=6551 RepID=UPI00300715B3